MKKYLLKLTNHDLLIAIVLVMLICFALAPLYAQQAPPAPAATAPAPAVTAPAQVSPLTLTVKEKTERDSLLAEVQSAQRELGSLFEQMLSTDDEDRVLGIYYRAKARATSRLKPANDKLTAWFDATRKAHKCDSCQLQGDTFVPAPLPGQVSSAATPAPK